MNRPCLLMFLVCVAAVAHRSFYFICSLGDERVKLSIEIEVPRQRFWLTFTLLLETISGLIIKIPLTRTKIFLLWDLN